MMTVRSVVLTPMNPDTALTTGASGTTLTDPGSAQLISGFPPIGFARERPYRAAMDPDPTVTPRIGTAVVEPIDDAPGAEEGAAATTPDSEGEEVHGLRRSTTNKVLGGVAGGIAERFEIDANVVRVVFIVACALWGLGAAVYLAMWVFVPRSGEEPPPEDGPVTRLQRTWLAWGLLAAVVALFLIALSIGLGAVHAGAAIGVLWLVFLIAIAIAAVSRPSRRLTIRRFLALSFLVACSLVILVLASFAGFLASTGVPVAGGTGEVTWAPTTSFGAATYRLAIGYATLDLTQRPYSGRPVTIDASVAVGKLRVLIPRNAAVDLVSHVGAGSVWGPGPASGSSGPGKLPRLDLNVQVGAGSIWIYRVGTYPQP